MTKPLASLSLDLDNKWSYLKTHGDPGWEEFPSYLDLVVPRVLEMLEPLGLKITFFVVGQDAAIDSNHAALGSIAGAGHGIGNHSFAHEPWLGNYSRRELEAEINSAEAAIRSATGVEPVGFRGPGFSWSPDLLAVLAERGYRYDASTFPTFLGPLAKAYYFMTARLSAEERRQRSQLFGGVREGFRGLKPYWWRAAGGQRLLEIPVTTIPICRAPFHLSYLLYLRQFSRRIAWLYFHSALRLCRVVGVEPSILLHPLDFLSGDDVPELRFFPAMRMDGATKLEFVRRVLSFLADRYRVVTMEEYAGRVAARQGVRELTLNAAYRPPDPPSQDAPRSAKQESSPAASVGQEAGV